MDLSLSSQQLNVQTLARKFAKEEVAPLSRRMDEEGQMPAELVRRMGELGLLGGPLPSEFGGGDWDNLSLVVAYEEIGKVDSSVRGLMTVHTSLVSQCILRWGSEDQLRTILPRLASGRLIGCYCLTEPRAGSDAASLETTVKPDGKDFVLSGEKTWITNGGIADLAIVFATKKPGGGREHISAFLIQTDNPGFHRESMPGVELGHRASDHAHIRLESCRVPGSSLLGKVGEGFKVAMSALDQGRLGVAAGAVGVAQACLDASLEFARQRRQFGRRIGDFGMIQATLADMAADVEAARMLVYRAAWLKDKGHDARRETSIAKLFATEAAVRAANEAVLVHGSRGYSNEFPVEHFLRDIKGLQIYEGTSHIQRIVIARDLIGRE